MVSGRSCNAPSPTGWITTRFGSGAEDIDEPLPGAVPEVLDATDRIARDYIASFDTSQVATQVRTLLIRMLPAGKVDQDAIANKLYRSASTLQRQLSAEGTSYRDILAETRESLASSTSRIRTTVRATWPTCWASRTQSNFGPGFQALDPA